MKYALLTLLAAGLLTACGRTENAKETSPPSTDDSVAASPAPTPARNCQSVIAADKLGKPLEYKESAKPIVIVLTLNPATSIVQTAGGCYTDNAAMVLVNRKSGKFMFKRTLLKDDLLYFVDTDETVRQSVLESVTYKPTFNGEKYFNLTVRLQEPVSKKLTSYTLFVNYYGEIVKVK